MKVLNDAAMQALGSYKGGKMLFLGLGTGLGSAMIVDGIVEPMELGHMPYKRRTFEDYVGARGYERLEKKWRREVADVVARLIAARWSLMTWCWEGDAQETESTPFTLPSGRQRDAFLGGLRLWE